MTKWYAPAGLRNNDFDEDLVNAVVDELRQKLTLKINRWITSGVVDIKLKRSDRSVKVKFSSEKMRISMTRLPDNEGLDSEYYNLFDPEFDPIKQICRFVDRALKMESNYDKEVARSKIMLDYLLSD